MNAPSAILARAAAGFRLSVDEALDLSECRDLAELMRVAERLALDGFGPSVT